MRLEFQIWDDFDQSLLWDLRVIIFFVATVNTITFCPSGQTLPHRWFRDSRATSRVDRPWFYCPAPSTDNFFSLKRTPGIIQLVIYFFFSKDSTPNMRSAQVIRSHDLQKWFIEVIRSGQAPITVPWRNLVEFAFLCSSFTMSHFLTPQRACISESKWCQLL